MAETPIDLRSDTVTKPSADMRRAMAAAEVGDDVFMEDPTVNRLQARAAEIFQREAALYVPSGSMGNLVCLLAHTRPGEEVICEENAHIYTNEMASMAGVAGLLPRLIATEDGIMRWEQIARMIRPKMYARAQTTLVCLENTHNLCGGTVYPTALAHEICDRSHEAGLAVHLDGSRVFNAAVFLDEEVAEMTKKFDSIQFCLSKGLGAPVGSMVVGSKAFILRCRSLRKMLGGGMRQAGVLAAAGLIALEEGPKRLGVDHANAKLLAQALARLPGLRLNPTRVQTNIVIYDVRETGLSSGEFLSGLAQRGLLGVPVDQEKVRMVAHLDVDRQDIEKAAAIIADYTNELASARAAGPKRRA
ncbi:MAG TPA: GntG family PLP-dependent aldolase [Verrucomicrobiae bacterium]|nr:GntG family PLP-dependent aldolase [Verrucomicrobiae bacterium]